MFVALPSSENEDVTDNNKKLSMKENLPDYDAVVGNGGTSSIALAVFNFTNSIVGAGLIGIPYAIQQCGFAIGIVMIFIIAYVIYTSVVMLIDCGIQVKKLDLEELAEKVIGRSGYYIALVFMFIFAFGAQIAYMVIIGDTVPSVLEEVFSFDHVDRNTVIICIATCVILPLCLLKDISNLSYASCISICSDIILVSIVCIHGPQRSEEEGINLRSGDFELTNTALFAGMGAMSFTFVCQHNSFMIFQSLREPTRRNWQKVAWYSLAVAVVVCLAMGLAGYFSFLDTVSGDILNNFSESDYTANIGRGLLALSMMMTFPMECYVSKHCLISLLKCMDEKGGATSMFDENAKESDNHELTDNADTGTCTAKDDLEEVYLSYRDHSTLPGEVEKTETVNPINSMHISNRDSIDISGFDTKHDDNNEVSSNKGECRRISITLLVWSVVVIIAVSCGNVGPVFALTGRFCNSFL